MTALAPEQTRKYRTLKPMRYGNGTLPAGELIEGQFGGDPIEQWPVEAIRACVGQGLIEPVPFEEIVTMGLTPLAYQIRTVLARGACTTQELASELGAAEDTVSRTLRRMRNNGKVVKLEGGGGRGVWARWGLKAGS